MSTLQEMRDKIRLQGDLDEEDLPNTTADAFIREAFDRTFAVEARWPFFEAEWTLTLPSGDTTLPLPTDPEVAFIQRIRNATSNYNLLHIDTQLAEDNFQGTITSSTEPDFFSTWGDTITLWPPPTPLERTYTMRGYRKASWTGVATDELDGDARLHMPIFHYAVSLTYAQLEDPELEQIYMQRWFAGVQALRQDIMRPRFNEPLILNGGLYTLRRRPRTYLDV